MNIRSFILKYFLFIILFAQCKKEKQNENEVSFLDKSPIIDGVLDQGLDQLTERSFNYIWQFDNPVTDTVSITYRMAYTPSHLYLYIESLSDSITYRRRGFLNGDGFKLLLAKPQKDSLTNEYYDMVFSASKDKKYWARKRIWEYNHVQGYHKVFSDNTLFEEKASNGKSGFEVLIAWEDIAPYHPWFVEKMGYNLYFAKAIGDTITNGYAVVEDEGIWDEELPKRNYQPISFGVPRLPKDDIIRFNSQKRNLIQGDTLWIKYVAQATNNKSKKIDIRLVDAQKLPVIEQEKGITLTKTFKNETFALPTGTIAEGVYQMLITSKNDTLLNRSITVFPKINFKNIHQTIQKRITDNNEGVANTLLFKSKQLEKQLYTLKDYEDAEKHYTSYITLKQELTSFTQEKDPYKDKTIPYRRAFRSKYDNTYQPYSIKLPKDYNSNKKYPLLVFLHGSGSGDVGLLNSERSNGNFIEIAPLGRDLYRAYASEESQKDILEAIEDVSKHFSVDRNTIVIGGFSMGGYGALRTYYENPNLYKGVAVFAGHPDLANYWLEGEYPNFMDPMYLRVFKKKPVFVYHGKKDGSLPVEFIEKMILKMEEIGVPVTKSIVEEKGHQYPDEQTNLLYFEWLNNVIQTK